MSNLFLALFLLSPIALLVGLIKPKLFSKFLPTRKKIALAFGGLTVLSFILFGVTAPPVKPKDEAKVAGEQTVASPSPTTASNLEQVKVIRVVDGDTIEIEGGQKVRYIGIDAPETVDPNRPVGCYGKEASNKNKELVEGKTVGLEKDISDKDKYGRLLRYVYVGDTFVNETLVKEGYAQVSTYPPDVKYQDKFLVAQKDARDNNRGLWSACPIQTSNPTTQPVSTPVVKATVKPATQTQTSCQYSCSGPDRDCSDFSTHAQAQAFFDCCGFSASNDPMRLDKANGQGNGLACESLP